MVVAFDNIIMAKIETNVLSQSKIKPPRVCPEHYLLEIRFLSVGCQQLIEQAYKFHTTVKFTAEVPEKENHIAVWDMYTVVNKEKRYQKQCYPLLQAGQCLSIYTYTLLLYSATSCYKKKFHKRRLLHQTSTTIQSRLSSHLVAIGVGNNAAFEDTMWKRLQRLALT